MKVSDFKQQIRGMDDCIKIIKKATKGCGQLSSNDNFFDNSCFIIPKTEEEENAGGVDYCEPVNTCHKIF